ncbi:MAG: hypothetical protein LUD07_06505 [Clostridiales bacterium]|nr:hypothetical protein [Clostridiales bacterium]
MESKAILYHSNKEDECKRFISEKDYLIVSKNNKDDIWLGKGMYFWDNRGNVDWWNKKQVKRHPEDIFSIIVANVNLEGLLDLTDIEIYEKLEELWITICKKAKLNVNKPLGNKLNYLMDIEKYSIVYSVIKVYGKYNRTPSDGIFKFDYKTDRAEPTIGVKCIYNVMSADCIIEKEYLIKEG